MPFQYAQTTYVNAVLSPNVYFVFLVIRAGFKGGPRGLGPRPPANRGPPTKPFRFFSFMIYVCLAFLIFRLLQSPT